MPKKSIEYDGEDAAWYQPGAPFRTDSVSSCCFQLSFSRRMALIRRRPPGSKSFPEGSPLPRMGQHKDSKAGLFPSIWDILKEHPSCRAPRGGE